MEEDSPKKKAPLVLNRDTLMYKSQYDDDPPPELVVTGERTLATAEERLGSRDIGWMSDLCIEEEIVRQKGHLEKLQNLPDNGEKLRARVRMLEEEQERRRKRDRVDADGSEKQTELESQNFTSALGDLTETVPSPLNGPQSEFCELFSKKIDEELKDSQPENAFESGFSNLSYGGPQNTRFNGQISTRGQQKSTLPFWSSPFQCPTKKSFAADKRKLSNGDQNGLGSPNCEEISSNSFKKRKKASLSLAPKGSRQNNGSTYVLVDEEEHEPEPLGQTEQAEEVDESMKDSKIYYPTRNDPESVEICYPDMQCLAPQAFLSSTIMNFYIRHLQVPTLAMERRRIDYHFFNTYFYSKLQKAVSKKDERESSFPKLRRWWKGVNIFHKAYILLPVHEDLHWSLVIICIPDKEDDSGPVILHLDSLGLHSSRSIFGNVKSFLIEEWKHLNEGKAPPDLPISNRIWKNLSRRIDEKRIEVPRQKNEYDCGLFVLYFMERFIGEAPQRLKRKDLTMFGRKWFKPEEASNLRLKIKKLLKEEFRKATQDNCILPESPKGDSQEQNCEQPMDT